MSIWVEQNKKKRTNKNIIQRKKSNMIFKLIYTEHN